MNTPAITAKQIIQAFVALLLLIAFVWLAFYALILVLVVAAAATAFFVIRRFLREQGILKADPEPMSNAPAENPNVIEAEYHDVTDDEAKP